MRRCGSSWDDQAERRATRGRGWPGIVDCRDFLPSVVSALSAHFGRLGAQRGSLKQVVCDRVQHGDRAALRAAAKGRLVKASIASSEAKPPSANFIARDSGSVVEARASVGFFPVINATNNRGFVASRRVASRPGPPRLYQRASASCRPPFTTHRNHIPRSTTPTILAPPIKTAYGAEEKNHRLSG